jgi:hypothetical protein
LVQRLESQEIEQASEKFQAQVITTLKRDLQVLLQFMALDLAQGNI